jgi:hypothetical protein
MLTVSSWKVRFLCMTYKYLSRVCESYSSPGNDQGESKGKSSETQPINPNPAVPNTLTRDVSDMLVVAKCQLKRIRETTEKIIRYLVSALLEPDLETTMAPDTHITGESNYFYVMATIWFVIKDFPDWNWDWIHSISTLTVEDYHFFERNYLPAENWTFGRADRDKVPVLRWYHYGSLLNLCDQACFPLTWLEGDLRQKVFRLEKAAKLAAAEKLSSGKPYIADDEITDRLSFLSDELELECTKSGAISTVARLTMKRVRQRDYTRELNPGWHPFHEVESTSGPWEIHALCHHSRLVVLTLEEKDSQGRRITEHAKDEIESYKQRVRGFLNGEGTLVPCWERAHIKARKGWLRTEASDVFSTTLLAADRKRINPPAYGLMKDRDQLDFLEKSIVEIGSASPIPWKMFCAPQQYHPQSFTNSLEDTPELYKAPRIEDIFIPVSLQKDVTPLSKKDEYTKDDLTDDLLKDFSISDIRADEGSEQDGCGVAWKARHLYFDSLGEMEKKKGVLLSWALYDSLVDQEVQHRFL